MPLLRRLWLPVDVLWCPLLLISDWEATVGLKSLLPYLQIPQLMSSSQLLDAITAYLQQLAEVSECTHRRTDTVSSIDSSCLPLCHGSHVSGLTSGLTTQVVHQAYADYNERRSLLQPPTSTCTECFVLAMPVPLHRPSLPRLVLARVVSVYDHGTKGHPSLASLVHVRPTYGLTHRLTLHGHHSTVAMSSSSLVTNHRTL